LCPAPQDVAGPGWNLEGVSTLTNNTPIRALLIDHVPVASVYFDVRATVDVPIRWRALAGRLGDDGAQTEIIEALTQRVLDAVPGPGVLAGRAGRRRPPRHRRLHRPRFLATVDHLLQTPEELRDELEPDSLDFLSFVELLSTGSGRRIDEDDYPALRTMTDCITFLST